MTTATISALESTVHLTNEWLDYLSCELDELNRENAYRTLRAVLIALRDRMPMEEAVDLGAQLPQLIRGAYYEGWRPHKTPQRQRTRAAFLEHVAEILMEPVDPGPEEAARAVFKLLDERISEGEVRHVKANLPHEVKQLWP